MIEAASKWLRDGGDDSAADLIEQCEIATHFVDLYFELGGDREYELYDVVVGAPRQVHRAIQEDQKLCEIIESTIRGCAEANGMYIRGINWVPKTTTVGDEKDGDLTAVLSGFNVEQVNRSWRKALARKAKDPEGAITAARSMLESLCKHILDGRGTEYDRNGPLPTLFHEALQSLTLAPRQQTDRCLRQVLGNCQSIVNALASIRNELGDAHGKAAEDYIADPAHAEFTVNIAHAITIFILCQAAREISTPRLKREKA